MYVRVHTDIPSSYSCGLFAGNVALSRGHTRLTRLQLYSLRGLSCLLQKHCLRYTIKLPSSVRGLVSLLSLFFSCFFLLAISCSLTLQLSLRSHRVTFSSASRLVIVAVVIVVHYMKSSQRKMQRPSSRSP